MSKVTHSEFSRLVNIMQKLRSPNGGCPWDLEQSHTTLKPYLLEEAYEVLDAIDMNDSDELKEELGDLLLQVVFHAQIAKDEKRFTIEDVAKEISDKMVRRHPHVFSTGNAKTAKAVVKNWEEIKKLEKEKKGKKEKSILESVSHKLPALFENFKISKKVAKQGFDWKKPNDVFDKIEEEIKEVKKAIRKKDKALIEEELGDLLFATANLCRVHKVNPEMALRQANQKFRKRFAKVESLAKKEKMPLKELSFKKWNDLWEKAKSLLR